jgi:hypothetical protein
LTETNGELCNVAGLPGSDPNPENELLNKDVSALTIPDQILNDIVDTTLKHPVALHTFWQLF